MKYEKKFNSDKQKRIVPRLQVQMAAKEFGSVEEMLRFNARQIVVPPEIARRLNRSIHKKLYRPWWRRWLG